MNEIWKEIPGYEFYLVSNIGNVKSLRKNLLLSQKLDRYGYYKVYLSINGIKKLKSVHQLVAMAFLGHTPDGTMNKIINHIDYDKTNNNVKNLEIVNPRKNIAHSSPKKISNNIGVSKHLNKYRSEIFYKNKRYYLGIYDSEIEASDIYLKCVNLIDNDMFEEFYLSLKNSFKNKFTSKYLGVNIHPVSGKYISQLTRNKKTYCLGRFDNEIDAYNEYVIGLKHFEDGTFDDYYEAKRKYKK